VKRAYSGTGDTIEQLAENSSFVETSFLLINGDLPTREQLTSFSVLLNDHSLIHEDMHHFFGNFPRAPIPWNIVLHGKCPQTLLS
jgi:citrate synthase